MEQKLIDKEFKSLIRKIDRFNERLFEIRKMCQTMKVYLDKSSTRISPPESIEQLVYSIYNNELSVWQSNEGYKDTWRVHVVCDEDGDEGFEGSYELEEDIKYMRKCIENGLKFWQSEDPDRFLESDDDDED